MLLLSVDIVVVVVVLDPDLAWLRWNIHEGCASGRSHSHLGGIDQAAALVDVCGGVCGWVVVVVVGRKESTWPRMNIGKPRAGVPPRWGKRQMSRVVISGLMV